MSGKAQHKYNLKNTKKYTFGFNLKTDADVILKLDTVKSKAGYVKELIRKDIDREVKSMESDQ